MELRIDHFDMSRSLDRRVSVPAIAVSLAALVATSLPATARADESIPEPLASVAALTESVAPAVTESVSTAADSLPATPAASAAPPPAVDGAPVAESAPAAEDEDPVVSPAPPVDAGPDDVPQVAPQPENATPESASEGDIATNAGDTGADTPSVAENPATVTQPAPSAAVVPAATGAANINISIRIDSPGDNGALTQLNVGAGAAAAPAQTSSAAQPQAATTAPTAPETPASSAPSTDTTGSSDTWYWNWDCLGANPISPISPDASANGSMPSSWTWIWNCGGNNSQYQIETPTGYQQINANVSIRISSPGNDGNVTQINLGAQASVAIPAPTRILPPALPRAVSAPSVGPLSAVAMPSLAQALIAALGPPDDASTRQASDIALVPIPQSAPVSTIPLAPTTALAPAAPKPGLLGSLGATGLPAGAGLRAAWAEGGTARPYADAAAVAREAAAAWAADGPRPADPSAPVSADSPAENRPVAGSAPRWKPPLPEPAVPAPLSGVSAAAATGGGGSSGTGLLFLLALPFVAALLDLARRVALEHATWPPGHRRRPPDRPG
jgi:hypothetical protein